MIPHSSVLHCASLLRKIFASLALANEPGHEFNERNFSQAELDSEINVCFLLKEHGNQYFFLLDSNSIHIILLNFWKKKINRKEERIQSVQQLLFDATYDRVNNDSTVERFTSTSF